MRSTSVYGYNPDPRFSVNHLTDYMASQHASQRDKVIQDAKFPRKKPITAYQLPKREIQRFFGGGARSLRMLDPAKASLAEIIRIDEEGRDEARRDLKALEAFTELWRRRRWNTIEMSGTRVDLPMSIEGTRINVRLDAAILERGEDQDGNSGGIVLFMAQTAQARKNIEERMRQVAQLIMWTLEGRNIEPLPRLCMAFDVFGQDVVRATNSTSRFRGYVRSACEEAALKWPNIAPPPDYDGPDL